MQCLQRGRGHCALDSGALAGATADGNVSGVFKAAAWGQNLRRHNDLQSDLQQGRLAGGDCGRQHSVVFMVAALGAGLRMRKVGGTTSASKDMTVCTPQGLAGMRLCALCFSCRTELLRHCSYRCLQRGRSFKPRAIHPAGSEDVVELLLAAKADPNTAALGGATALHAAAAGGTLTIVLALLQVRRCT